MARKRLTMKKIKEVIRLKYEAVLSNRVTPALHQTQCGASVAGACKMSNSTVNEYLRPTRACT